MVPHKLLPKDDTENKVITFYGGVVLKVASGYIVIIKGIIQNFGKNKEIICELDLIPGNNG